MIRRDVHLNQIRNCLSIYIFRFTPDGERLSMHSYYAYPGATVSHRARRALRGMRLLSAALKQEFKLRGDLQ